MISGTSKSTLLLVSMVLPLFVTTCKNADEGERHKSTTEFLNWFDGILGETEKQFCGELFAYDIELPEVVIKGLSTTSNCEELIVLDKANLVFGGNEYSSGDLFSQDGIKLLVEYLKAKEAKVLVLAAGNNALWQSIVRISTCANEAGVRRIVFLLVEPEGSNYRSEPRSAITKKVEAIFRYKTSLPEKRLMVIKELFWPLFDKCSKISALQNIVGVESITGIFRHYLGKMKTELPECDVDLRSLKTALWWILWQDPLRSLDVRISPKEEGSNVVEIEPRTTWNEASKRIQKLKSHNDEPVFLKVRDAR